MKPTVSATFRLSTGFPYRSTIRTAISVVPPTVTSDSYQMFSILYGAAWSICCMTVFVCTSAPSSPLYEMVTVIGAVPLAVAGVKTAVAMPVASVVVTAGVMLPKVLSTANSIVVLPIRVLPEVLFSTCTVMVAVSLLPTVSHSVSVLISTVSGIRAAAGVTRRSSPATIWYACIHLPICLRVGKLE